MLLTTNLSPLLTKMLLKESYLPKKPYLLRNARIHISPSCNIPSWPNEAFPSHSLLRLVFMGEIFLKSLFKVINCPVNFNHPEKKKSLYPSRNKIINFYHPKLSPVLRTLYHSLSVITPFIPFLYGYYTTYCTILSGKTKKNNLPGLMH